MTRVHGKTWMTGINKITKTTGKTGMAGMT